MRRRWKYKIADLFLRFYTRKRGRLCSRDSFTASEDFQRIAIFSSTALGDFLLNTPAIKAIRRRYPCAEITLIASAKNRALVERDETGLLYDRVVYWNNKLQTVNKLVRELTTNGQCDLTVILHSHGPYDVVAAVMAGSRYIFRDNLMRMNGLHEINKWLTNYVSQFYGHYIQRKLELIKALNAPTDDVTMSLPFSITREKQGSEIFLIGFQLGAAKKTRTWPVEYFADLANNLLSYNENIRIAVIGSPQEQELATQLLQLVNPDLKNRVINYSGQTTLRQLIDIIASMDLLIVGDTGPLHIAIALKIRTISLFISSNPQKTGPYQDLHLHSVINPTHQIMDVDKELFSARGIIKPEQVAAQIKEIL
ncbi:MAG: glycosyltransferase family 9 protein [Enterobacteriaceae bacterium]